MKQRRGVRDLYLCVSGCVRIIATVFCVTVLFGSYYPSIRVHPTRTQYSGEMCTASTSSKREARETNERRLFLKKEVVHQILFTINLIFKHYFRPVLGANKIYIFIFLNLLYFL